MSNDDLFLDIQQDEDGELVVTMTDGVTTKNLNDSADPEIVEFLRGLVELFESLDLDDDDDEETE